MLVAPGERVQLEGRGRSSRVRLLLYSYMLSWCGEPINAPYYVCCADKEVREGGTLRGVGELESAVESYTTVAPNALTTVVTVVIMECF